jgi:hypothetical protein
LRFKAELRWLDKMFLMTFQSMTIPKIPTKGMSAHVPHTNEYVIFLDYDNIKDEPLKDRLLYMQELYHLGDFHVLATNEFGRHCVCIDRLPLREAYRILRDSDCDPIFVNGIRLNEFRTWILRTEAKGKRSAPKYLYPMYSDYNGENLQSQAHALFLKQRFDINVRLVNPDGNKTIEMQDYKTSHKVETENEKENNNEKT